MAVQTVIKLRRDTAANWTSVNPVLASGEEGYETDTGARKVGNGSTAWNSLDYIRSDSTIYKVRNNTGSTILKGTLVSATGAESSGRIDVAPFEVTGEQDSELRVMGVAIANISSGVNGNVMSFGTLTGLDTRGTVSSALAVGDEDWNEGDILYAHPTVDGKLTKVRPQHDLAVAFITVSHATTGQIAIRIVPGNFHLEWMHDVSITDPATGDVLTYDSVSGLWINSEGGTGSASITVSDTAPVDPEPDSMWFNSAEASAYIYYDDTWVPLSPGIAGPAGPTGVIVSDTAPTNTAQIWADPNATGSYIVPPSGSRGQVLTKITDSSYDTGWVTPQGSGNAIINGAFDIWQRGTSTFTANGFTADRWSLGKGGSSTIAISQQTHTPGTILGSFESQFFLRFARSTWNNNDYFGTKIEDVRQLAGQTITLSFYAKAAAGFTLDQLVLGQNFGSGGSATVETSVTAPTFTTSWARYTFTVTLPSVTGKTIGTGSNLEIYFRFGSTAANCTLDLDLVQLESGSTATPFRRNAPSIQAELAACQRYYYRSSGSIQTLHSFGPAYSTTQALIPFYPPVTMRIAPTSVEISNLGLQRHANDSYIAVSSITLFANSSAPGVAALNCNATGLTVGTSYNLKTDNNGAGFLAISAEL